MRTKYDQALSVVARLQTRVRSWEDTTRNLILLASQDAEAVAERNELAAHPLAFVHGVLGRIAQELGPEVSVVLYLDDGKLKLRVVTPGGAKLMAFNDQDYNQNTDLLAVSIRQVCEQGKILSQAKEM